MELILPFPYFRTFQKTFITKNEMGNVSRDLVVKHLAIFERSIELGGRTYLRDYVASCVTLMSKESVPPGINYRVRTFEVIAMVVHWVINLFLPAWHVYKCI